MSSHAQQAQTLVEALPYIQKFTGKTIVIKYGGNAMISDELRKAVMSDIILLSLVGIRVVVVHGGGPEISAMLKKIGHESHFVDGLRYTDEETMDVVQSVLCGKVNKNLVAQLNRLGGQAIGLCGMDGAMFQAEQLDAKYGLVGRDHRRKPGAGGKRPHDRLHPGGVHRGPGRGRRHRLQHQCRHRRCQAGGGPGGGEADPPDGRPGPSAGPQGRGDAHPRAAYSTTCRPSLPEGIISGGMIPKIECSVEAINGGVERVHILDGRIPHSILIELLSDRGIGTMLKKEDEA